MYNEEYDDEQDVKASDNFIVNFYYNNKVLIWILVGVIAFILIMSLLTRGGSSGTSETKYEVTITPETAVEISIGNSYSLKAKVKNNSNAIVSWSSEDENIAKVDGTGTVTAVNYGKTKIMATYIHNDDNKYTAFKEITVADGNPNLALTDVSFKTGDLLMPLNSTYKISLVLKPSNGYVTNKVFTSSNVNVVTVDNTGTVTSVGEGEATITLNVNDGAFKKELKVYVSKDYTRSEIIVSPTTITLDSELLKMKIGLSQRLRYTLFPTDADSTKLVWSSSDEIVATVDQNGIVKALKEGHATITLKSVTGVYDTIDVEVETNIVEVTDIILTTSNLYLNLGQNITITPVISPADASNKAMSFITSDSSVVAVYPNQTGTEATLYALRAGTAVVTIISSNNIEKRMSVSVLDSSSGGGSSSGGSSGSGGTSNAEKQGFTVSSKDATGVGFIVTSYNKTINNVAKGPVTVTVTKNNSSIAKIRLAICLYPASTCDPDGSVDVKEITSSLSFTMNNAGEHTYLLRFATYNSSGARIGTYDKYIAIKGSGSSASTTASNACYCNSIGNCTWASGGSSSFPIKNTTYNTEAKCNEHIAITCCHRSGSSYVNSTTVKSNCVSESLCSGAGAGSTGYACYCNSSGYCIWATSGTSSYPTKNTTYNTEAKCNDNLMKVCCHRSGSSYVRGTTKNSNCVSDSLCSGGSGKLMKSLSYSCANGVLGIKDGSTILNWNQYCSMYNAGANNVYYCTGGSGYSGSCTAKCQAVGYFSSVTCG